MKLSLTDARGRVRNKRGDPALYSAKCRTCRKQFWVFNRGTQTCSKKCRYTFASKRLRGLVEANTAISYAPSFQHGASKNEKHPYSRNGRRALYQTACAECTAQFWVYNRGTKTCSKKCRYGAVKGILQRSGKPSFNWKGGRIVGAGGYIYLFKPEHPMANKGYMLEHRVVMEGVLGRQLERHEEVHHRNGNRQDNAPLNLELWKIRTQPSGVRATDYHCAGCRCSELRHPPTAVVSDRPGDRYGLIYAPPTSAPSVDVWVM